MKTTLLPYDVPGLRETQEPHLNKYTLRMIASGGQSFSPETSKAFGVPTLLVYKRLQPQTVNIITIAYGDKHNACLAHSQGEVDCCVRSAV